MVNFGDFLKKSQVTKHSKYYIPYDVLKKYLEDGMKASRVQGGKMEFYRELEFSYNNCKNYADEWLARVEEACEISSSTAGDKSAATVISSKNIYSPELIADILELNQFVYLNQEAFRKIIKKHDKNFPKSRLMSIWQWKLDMNLGRRIIDAVFKVMASKPKVEEDILHIASSTDDNSSSPMHQTHAPSTKKEQALEQDRKSIFALATKNKSNADVEMGQISSNKLTDSLLKNASSDGDYVLASDSYVPPSFTPVSIPSPSQQQAGSAAPAGGAGLNKQTDSFVRQSTKYWVRPNDLAAVCTVLSENLNLHSFGPSPWTPISSVYLDNMNFNCYQSRIVKDTGARIIRLRTYDDDENKIYVERKVHHEKWTGETSSKDRFVVSNSNIMSFLRGIKVPANKENLNTLRNELTDMVLQYKLFPVVRIDYTRVAFQPQNHDHVRVSIDFNMKLIREKCSHTEWKTPSERILENDVVHFPYAVVEVKLREPYISTPPLWLENLEKSSLLHKENNFSKYIHAVYAFQEMDNNPLKLRTPSWWNKQEFTSPQLAIMGPEEIAEKKKAEAHANEIHWFARLLGLDPNTNDEGGKVKIEPKTFFACERTFLTWFNSALFVGSIGVALSTASVPAVGDLLIAVSCCIILYAINTYIQRTKSLLNKRPAGYHDRYGPIALATIVIIVFIAAPIITSPSLSKSTSKK